MAESTIVKTRIDGTLQLAALGGGAYDIGTGALDGAAESYTVSFENGDHTLKRRIPLQGITAPFESRRWRAHHSCLRRRRYNRSTGHFWAYERPSLALAILIYWIRSVPLLNRETFRTLNIFFL